MGKAYTVDDTLFLRQAQHALHDPLHPSAFDYQWSEAQEARRLSQYMPSGPVMAYLLIPSALLERGEWVGHLVEVLFLCMAAVAVASIGVRLGFGERAARLAALLLVASPAVLAMSATCMPDTVAMALAAVGIERTLAWRETSRWRDAACASATLALAILTRAHCAILLVPALVFALAHGSAAAQPSIGRRLAGALPVAVAPVLGLALLRLTRDPATGGDVASSVFTLMTPIWRPNLVAFLVHHTLALPFGIGVLVAGARLRWRELLLVAAYPIVGYLARHRLDLFVMISATVAFAAYMRVFVSPFTRPRAINTAIALWLLAPLPVVCYLHFPSKYLLASAPAGALFLARLLDHRGPAMRRVLASLLIIAGAVLGTAIIRADAQMAGLGRRAARTVVAPAVRAGTTVWFAGHWGFQWYVEQAGAKPLLPDAQPTGGDVIVVSRNNSGYARPYLAGCVPIRELSEGAPGGRIMAGGAGFYSNAWGVRPWVWSTAPDEHISVCRVAGAWR